MGADAAGGARGRRRARRARSRGLRGRFLPLVRDLTGRSVGEITARLRGQVEAAVEGARVARRAADGRMPSSEAREAISEVEHRGDEERAGLVDLLAYALVTPIDREDLFRLSRSIDDVLDNLRDFVRELDLFDAAAYRPFGDILDAVQDVLQHLEEAIDHLADEPGNAGTGALAAKKGVNVIRQLYQHSVADVLDHDPVTSEMLKRRELLRRLDVVGLRLGEAGDALADGAMKRSH